MFSLNYPYLRTLPPQKAREQALVRHELQKPFNMEGTKPDISEVASFDASKLKHVETEEKNPLPSSESKFENINVLLHKATPTF